MPYGRVPWQRGRGLPVHRELVGHRVEPLRDSHHRADLDRQLDQVRRRDYAVSSEESEEGVSSVAVAFAPTRAPARLAFNVSLPTSRLTKTDQARIGTALVETVREAGAVLHS
ncbi:IclR family transcriptional regulator C-terminal domain-containing protein [Pseudonocardia sp. NPDC046786]|uniref:IclR family transcriptional regulator domain-containing protein n=1 Tax=Pseudonocardia sp. NPDC046786 TaxID=3155471 RepID=UPI003403530B